MPLPPVPTPWIEGAVKRAYVVTSTTVPSLNSDELTALIVTALLLLLAIISACALMYSRRTKRATPAARPSAPNEGQQYRVIEVDNVDAYTKADARRAGGVDAYPATRIANGSAAATAARAYLSTASAVSPLTPPPKDGYSVSHADDRQLWDDASAGNVAAMHALGIK